ncbi:hypothetical protein ACTFIR_006151 [Dictyostelium discoideum]
MHLNKHHLGSHVIEFHGAYWHGHPKLKVDPLNENEQSSRLKKTIEKDLEIVKHHHLLVCWYFNNNKTYTRFYLKGFNLKINYNSNNIHSVNLNSTLSDSEDGFNQTIEIIRKLIKKN